MNREIKFRAWHNNEMYDVNTLGLNLKGINPGMSFAHKEHQSSLKMRQDCIMFNEETIFMQFTGLKDKNGREIYEGDILIAMINSTIAEAEVKFYNGAFYLQHIKVEKMAVHLSEQHYWQEIIGNIYENEELLK